MRAAREIRARKLRETAALPLLDFVPHAWRTFGFDFEAPRHLAPLAHAIERAYRGERVRFGFSVPPQHGKSKTLVAALAKGLIQNPGLDVGYASYIAQFSLARSDEVRKIVEYYGVSTKGSSSLWRTQQFGGLKAGGIDHGFTGNPFKIMMLDDPYDGRKGAESASQREAVEDFIVSTLEKRCRAIILVHTRWTPNDALGLRLKNPDWEVVNLPVECDDPANDPLGRAEGELLWPNAPNVASFPVERMNPYDWWSLFMGQPRPKGDALFNEPSYWEGSIPEGIGVRVRFALGADFAFTEKTSADWSVLVLLARVDLYEGGKLVSSQALIVDVLRRQVRTDAFAKLSKQFVEAHRVESVPIFCYAYGAADNEAVDHLKKQGLRAIVLKKSGDKHARSLDASVAWNAGLLKVRRGAQWTADFVDRMCSFTGVGDEVDDEVDALAPAYDSLNFPKADLAVFGTRLAHPYGSTGSDDEEARVPKAIPTGGANGAVLPMDPDDAIFEESGLETFQGRWASSRTY